MNIFVQEADTLFDEKIALGEERVLFGQASVLAEQPEFAAAVESALPTARFLPAENGGETVPFYLIMTFEFRGG